ncbi:hypothetical protein LTR56_025632 [Elasticomyces elasticus]|nr:hypothetical protein LTR56_025632 [Elasticomyces elasticus]KAK3632173.1 hypothetical protein LTR22_020684 [Elasticomyces elasticus]KAK4904208.1 hypothetical protein LTR49_026299 [Elasticomyces elasticus]KAK5739463.1 hypothetical protein LTS12_025285 [Elasticomyces elasticus]
MVIAEDRRMSSRKTSFATTIGDPTENTPLLERKKSTVSVLWQQSTVYRVLLTAFLVSLSFGVTQVPLIYVFGVMTCDEYYQHHDSPPPGLSFDHRCQVHTIEASTARSVALLGTSTTFFGVANLFFTSWTMKAMGVKKALQLTVFFPAVRLAIQNIGVETGAGMGILIVQLSQIITIIGGPVGYLLALNSLATEVVEPAERTATLGRLSGCAMFGMAFGYLAGGLIGDYLGIIWPFRVTLVLFLLCCLYIQLCLPTIHNKVEGKAKTLSSFFDPIKMFAPAKWVLDGGKVQREYGVLLLGIGTFLGVLATSYIPVLLQMYATDIFHFGTSQNGLLISINSLIRGLFLTLAFPLIISGGRKWLDKRSKAAAKDKVTAEESGIVDIPVAPEQVAAGPKPIEGAAEPTVPPKPFKQEDDDEENKESFHFDLMFTKYSLVLDGLLTGLATFTTSGWQMYLVAIILPLASGTGSAAKGTILHMCSAEQRQDALSAISLVELMARLASTSVFGLVFSAFAEVGQTHLTFLVNASIAVLGFGILMFARFPPKAARRWVKDEEDEVVDET